MLPLLSLHPISQEPFVVSGVQVLPLPVGHVNEINFGFRIKNVAYLTDISDLPESTKARLEGLDLLVLDCIQLKPHHSHFHLERALEVIQELRPRRSVLTHLSHSIDYKRVSKTLPPSVSLAYDGMKIRVK
jgi:phosphoribosyl 1,2-cyclic phosphate phosphodiesterase